MSSFHDTSGNLGNYSQQFEGTGQVSFTREHKQGNRPRLDDEGYFRQLDDIIMGTRRLGISVEGYFQRFGKFSICLLYTSPSPRDRTRSRMPSSA